VADLAGLLQLDQRPDRLLDRHLWVGPVQLVEVDPVDRQAAQAHRHALAQVLGPPDRLPDTDSGPGQPALGRDDQVLRVRVQCLTDEVLADERPVGIGGVDEVRAQLDRAPEHPDRLVAVRRLAPDPGAGDLHRAEAEAVDDQVPAEREGVHAGNPNARPMTTRGPATGATIMGASGSWEID
jgi:hypothetical protein